MRIPAAYDVCLTMFALETIYRIADQHDLQLLSDRIDRLKQGPETQGSSLIGKLFGYRSVRTADQRYRIVYRVEQKKVVVLFVGIGQAWENNRTGVYTMLRLLNP